VIFDSRPGPSKPLNLPSNILVGHAERCSEQKRSFDLRRSLQIAEDSKRLHLEEIHAMLSPTDTSRSAKTSG
jgi:hypothetical protein